MGGLTADLVHGSCVALGGRGLLILGPSGSGKSTLALKLIATGATLVADDQVRLRRAGSGVVASAPERLAGMIEARGVGLLRADFLAETLLVLVVDLARKEPDRLPPFRHIPVLGCTLDLVSGAGNPHLETALLQWLRGGGRVG
ncbi:HPr kinase/phosphorylase [Gemmobacter lutimaris]|uniref:HPr kinase/phosphorylase n=1 Tax=Gemmobacter lutimaris TaxID=2306023 RepID=UPI001F1B753E|nr:serine kinase [Gemmobacter lutimaris]